MQKSYCTLFLSQQMAVREVNFKEQSEPTRGHFPRRNVITEEFFETLSVDLVEFIPSAPENRGYKYILSVIDHFSKIAITQPLKNKSGAEVAEAMRDILSECPGRVINVHSDHGKEFYNSHFKKVMDEWQIKHHPHIKNVVCESFIQTLKGML